MKQILEVRASQLSRIMSCSGSTQFELLVQPTNEAAMAGTACGELLAHKLIGTVQTGHATNGVAFDEDMQFYTDEVAKEIFTHNKTQIECETKVGWQTRSGIPVNGSSDVTYISHEGFLCIDDLKYGWNIVDVKPNWQLLVYAIGEVIRRQQHFPFIRLRIIQPRPHHEDGPIREWILSYDELLGYKEQIEVRMEQIASGAFELVTGKQCKYCPAAVESCTAFNRLFYASLDYTLNHVQQDSIGDQEVSFQLDLVARASEVIKIKSDSLKDLAVSRIKSGAIIPGYVTVENYGDRKWKKDISPLVIKTMTGKDIVEQVMMSPAKAEKLGVPKDLIATFVDRYFIGQKLVRKDAGKLADKIFNNVKGN